MLEEYLGDDFVDGFDEVVKFRKCRKESKDKKLYDKNNFGLSVFMWNDFFCVDNIEVVLQYFNIGYGYLLLYWGVIFLGFGLDFN